MRLLSGVTSIKIVSTVSWSRAYTPCLIESVGGVPMDTIAAPAVGTGPADCYPDARCGTSTLSSRAMVRLPHALPER